MPTNLSGSTQVPSRGLFSSSTDATEFTLGAKVYSDDKVRSFRWVLVGGTALVPGKLYQASAEITNHQNVTPATAAAGATSITVTLGATAATANYYADGWAIVTTGTGAGYQYRIASNPAADASASLTITLDDALIAAIAVGDSKIDLVANPYSGVIVNPTTATSCVVGVACYAAAAASYSWVQTGGVAAVLADGALAVGTNVAASNAVAGAVEAATGVQALVGIAVTGVADTQYGAVRLTFDV